LKTNQTVVSLLPILIGNMVTAKQGAKPRGSNVKHSLTKISTNTLDILVLIDTKSTIFEKTLGSEVKRKRPDVKKKIVH